MNMEWRDPARVCCTRLPGQGPVSRRGGDTLGGRIRSSSGQVHWRGLGCDVAVTTIWSRRLRGVADKQLSDGNAVTVAARTAHANLG